VGLKNHEPKKQIFLRNENCRHGSGLPTAGEDGAQEGAAVLAGVPGGDPDGAARAAGGVRDAGVHSVGRREAVRRLAPHLRLGQQPTLLVPVRPLRRLLRLEGHRHGQELHQRQNLPREEVKTKIWRGD
jgi:hypothetical protein